MQVCGSCYSFGLWVLSLLIGQSSVFGDSGMGLLVYAYGVLEPETSLNAANMKGSEYLAPNTR